MAAPAHDLNQLVSLIEAARAEAERVGSVADPVADALRQASLAARALVAGGGHPDEGLRPDQLTTGNDG